MKFSVAIPVYRQADFLPSALESIRVQVADVEVAVMDATPDDSVQKVLERYAGLLTYHRFGPDSGQTSAIQEGWDNTTGEIIAWLCADDYYFSDALGAVRQVFIDVPEVDVVYGDSVFVDETGRFLGYFPAIKSNISSITRECCISQPSCFVRRSAFEKIGGELNTGLHYTMDWDLWIRLYRSGAKFYYLNKPLSVVRMYEGTKTSSRSFRRFFEIGCHLFKNTSPFSAARSLLGFYYQDLLSNPNKGFDRLMLRLLDAYRSRKKMWLNMSNTHECKYGFYNNCNLVSRHVDIYLPWYDDMQPTKVVINCDLNNAPIAYLNDTQLKPAGSKFYYDILEMDASKHLLHLQLSSLDNRSWHLYDVKFI